jgi:hypothetical protein
MNLSENADRSVSRADGSPAERAAAASLNVGVASDA